MEWCTHAQAYISSICLYLYVYAFSHVLPVILCPVIMVNTKVSGQVDESSCWLSPPFSSPSNHVAGRNCWGDCSLPFPPFSLPLCLPLSFFLSHSLLYHEPTGKEGGWKMRQCCIRFVKACLVQLVSRMWIAQFRGRAVASSAEAVWAYKCEVRCLEICSSVPSHCVYTVYTHKKIGSICIPFEWREMCWQDHR